VETSIYTGAKLIEVDADLKYRASSWILAEERNNNDTGLLIKIDVFKMLKNNGRGSVTLEADQRNGQFFHLKNTSFILITKAEKKNCNGLIFYCAFQNRSEKMMS